HGAAGADGDALHRCPHAILALLADTLRIAHRTLPVEKPPEALGSVRIAGRPDDRAGPPHSRDPVPRCGLRNGDHGKMACRAALPADGWLARSWLGRRGSDATALRYTGGSR